MSESNIDCNACLHSGVCKHLASVQAVASVARQLSFSCKQCTPKTQPREEKKAEPLPKAAEPKEKAGPPCTPGECNSCKKVAMLYKCSSCGKLFCENCMESSTTVDPFSGDTVQKMLCMECSREEDEY